MPAILEFAKKHWLWIAGAGILLVAVWYFRNRQQAPQDASASGEGAGFGAGATMPSAPASNTTAATDSAGDQLAQLQLAAGQEQLSEQKAMFGLQFGQQQAQAALQNSQLALQGQYQQGLLPSLIAAGQAQAGYQAAQFDTQAAVQKQLQKVSPDHCPGGTSMRLDPNTGQYVCRQKSSGGILGDITRIVTGALGGVQAAAPAAGYQIANAAGSAFSQDVGGLINAGLGIAPSAGYAAQGAAHPAQAPTGMGGFGFGGLLGTPPLLSQQPQVSLYTPTMPRPIAAGGPNQFSGLPPASGIG